MRLRFGLEALSQISRGFRRTMTEGGKKKTGGVVVGPRAFVSAALHAVTYRRDAVHGVLLGTWEEGEQGGGGGGGTTTAVVTDAVPVSHGAPTRPVVEAALGLVRQSIGKQGPAPGASDVVGWYTAPALLEDGEPGPVALRMAANLAAGDSDPVLLVLQNEALAACCRGEGGAAAAVKALGRDFGNQWLESLTCAVREEKVAVAALREARQQSLQNTDFVAHLDGPPSSSWYPNQELSKLITKLS
jgi:hypothetical protein